jgi:hypothetical protein
MSAGWLKDPGGLPHLPRHPEKYPATSMILNGKGQCLMHVGKFEQTQGLLLESLKKVSSIHFSYRNLGSKIFGHQSSPSLCASHTK